VGQEFQVPRSTSLRIKIVHTHQHSHAEGTTMPLPLGSLKRFGMGPHIIKTLYSCTLESILTGCITACYGNCLASDSKTLQREMRTTQYTKQDLEHLLPPSHKTTK
jgi:hypothetical protein